MKYLKISLMLISIGLLTACGGGGGSSSQANPINPSINSAPDKYKEAIRKVKTIQVGDTKLDLASMPVGFFEKNAGNEKLKGFNLVYAFSMGIMPKDASLFRDYKSEGMKTELLNLPEGGVATYNGYSRGATSKGKMQLNVDFGKKTVSGKLYERIADDGTNMHDFILNEGKIVSYHAGFEGSATHHNTIGYRYFGAFYGPQAEEVQGHININPDKDKDMRDVEIFGGTRGEIKTP